jgi:hypothetical protein
MTLSSNGIMIWLARRRKVTIVGILAKAIEEMRALDADSKEIAGTLKHAADDLSRDTLA